MAKAKKSNTPQNETHQFGAEVDKILQLMIHSLYAHKDIFLRELISNASDACDKLRYEALTNSDLHKEDEALDIRIVANTKDKTLTITDKGIGMDHDEMIQNLGTIASSGTQRFVEAMTGDSNKDVQLIGQFGVGFYSSFMVADNVTVLSKKAGTDTAWKWQSKGDGNYTVETLEEDFEAGTSIILHIKEDCGQYLDRHRIEHIVQTYSDHISFPVKLQIDAEEEETINSGSALWARPKNKITDEQYNEFYRHIAHAGDEPWMTLHNKSEGVIEFTNLLFIPSAKPFDLFHPDRMTRVKLYVKRVFITEENIDLIPRHFRFLQGVVDSEDLPLNISRETLQHNAVIHKIRNSISKKLLGELKKKADKDPESYTKFWNNFGAVLKEGLCEGIDANRDKLMEICRFKTTKSGDNFVSLDEYVSNMKDGQKEIYFMTGDDIEILRNSPQLEGFKSKDIEVILLNEHVDSFWVSVVHDYKETPLRSATQAGIEFDEIKDADDAKSESGDKKQSNKKDKAPDNLDEIIALFKTALGEQVKDVVASKKLTDSPTCLVVPEGAMDSKMERFLIDQNQIASTLPKILEINPTHPLVEHIGKNVKDDSSKELAELLFDQACVIEGEVIKDPAGFSKRMNAFLKRVL